MKLNPMKLTLLAAVAACGTGTTALAAAMPTPAQPAATVETGAAYKRLAERVGPALVTVKYILKIEGGGQMADMMGGDEGRETEITGLVIEPNGLVLCSNTKMGGFAAMMGMMGGGGGGGVTANPTDIRILAGDDTEGLKAKILARDSDLDLCWVQVDDEKAKGKTFEHVDLKASAAPGIGDKIMVVQRRGKFFDHALVIGEGRVGGLAKKPRNLVSPSGVEAEMGMPVFTADGKLVGIGVLQMPSREDMEGGDMSSMFEGFGGGGPVILPADEVAKATERGKEMGAKGAEAKPAPPAETPAAEADKK
jgi:S1-C subfamily serine protease